MPPPHPPPPEPDPTDVQAQSAEAAVSADRVVSADGMRWAAPDAPQELSGPPPLPPTPFFKSPEDAAFERTWLCAAEPLGAQGDACAEPPCAPVGCFGGPAQVVPRGREAQGDARWEAGDLAGAAREYARAVGHHSTVEGGAFPPTAVSVLTARGWLRLGIALLSLIHISEPTRPY